MNKQKSVKRKGETASAMKRGCLGGNEATRMKTTTR